MVQPEQVAYLLTRNVLFVRTRVAAVVEVRLIQARPPVPDDATAYAA